MKNWGLTCSQYLLQWIIYSWFCMLQRTDVWLLEINLDCLQTADGNLYMFSKQCDNKSSWTIWTSELSAYYTKYSVHVLHTVQNKSRTGSQSSAINWDFGKCSISFLYPMHILLNETFHLFRNLRILRTRFPESSFWMRRCQMVVLVLVTRGLQGSRKSKYKTGPASSRIAKERWAPEDQLQRWSQTICAFWQKKRHFLLVLSAFEIIWQGYLAWIINITHEHRSFLPETEPMPFCCILHRSKTQEFKRMELKKSCLSWSWNLLR